MVGACAEVLVEARSQFIQPVSPGADGPRGAVALARLQAHLTRQQELGGCQEVLSVDASLGTETVIPAPGQMYGVNPAGAEAETLGSGRHEQGCVGTGAPAPAFPHVCADRQLAALRRSFLQVPACGVQDFGGVGGQREEQCERVEIVDTVTGVGHRVLLFEESRGRHFEPAAQAQ